MPITQIMMMKTNFERNILVCLLSFLGISALGGGLFLIISPSGKLIGGLPLSILKNSPFQDFLIPGIILFLVIGIVPLLTAIALIKKPMSVFAEKLNVFKDLHWSRSFSIYVAFALIIWIQVESIFVQSVGWLQTFYLLYALPIIVIALLPKVRLKYKK